MAPRIEESSEFTELANFYGAYSTTPNDLSQPVKGINALTQKDNDFLGTGVLVSPELDVRMLNSWLWYRGRGKLGS